jgi:putative oxidoreductase
MGLPLAVFMAYLAKIVEFFGGMLFAIGFLTRPVSAVLTLNMLIALGAGHGFNIFEGEMAGIYMAVFAAFMAIGGGRYSMDMLLFKR